MAKCICDAVNPSQTFTEDATSVFMSMPQMYIMHDFSRKTNRRNMEELLWKVTKSSMPHQNGNGHPRDSRINHLL